MKEIFTKSSVEAKMTPEKSDIFAKVCEKGINDFTEKNQEYTNDFKLPIDEEEYYRLKKFRFLKTMPTKHFASQAIADRFVIRISHGKNNKSFIKCYQSKELVLEIAASPRQIEAIEDKYHYYFKLDGKTENQDKYQLFYAGTFMEKSADATYLSSKLTDLRLFKVVKIKRGN